MTRLGLVALFAGLAAAPAAGQWTVTRLHPPGAVSSRASCGNGSQQGGFTVVLVGGIPRGHAALWSGASSWVDLNPAGATESAVLGYQGGQQVGNALISGSSRASLWSGSAASWVNLHPAGPTESRLCGVHAGQQVGYVSFGNSNHASLWSGTAASWVDFHPPGAGSSYIYAARDGQMVGTVDLRACLWGPFVDLHPAAASESIAWGVGDGQQVGQSYVSGTHHASLWSGTAASWVDLHPAGATESYAYGVAAGEQVGSVSFGGSFEAILWSGSAASWVSLQALLPPEFSSSGASAIWRDGNTTYVAGSGNNAALGRSEALLWKRTVALPCYPNCDGSTLAPILNVNDYVCFNTAFAAGSSYANCDGSTAAPVLNVGDFICFMNKYAAGCP